MSVPGYRNDEGKPLYSLLPTDALEGVAKVLTFGAKKYDHRNWEKGMDWSRCFNSMMRHSWAWWRGEDLDSDSGLPHVDHIVCNALFLAAYWRRAHLKRFDDRENVKKCQHEQWHELYDPSTRLTRKVCSDCRETL